MASAGQGQNKSASSASNGQNGNKKGGKKDPQCPDDSLSDISFNNPSCELNCKSKFKYLEARIKELENSFNANQAKISALETIIEKKDSALADLNQQVGFLKSEVSNLKTSCNFLLTKETSDLKNENQIIKEKHHVEMKEVRDKTIDLEDRSRRDNLVFYGIDESSGEDCEKLVIEKIFINSGLFKKEEIDESVNIFERVHRLGPKKRDQERPRPIIAKLGSFKDKERILQRSYKLKDTPFGVAEDFSKPTLQIRSELVAKAKHVRDQHDYIKGFHLKHTRLILKYENPDNGNIFHRGFNIADIRSNPKWYLPNMNRKDNR